MSFQFTPLGAGNEVGRSCHIIQHANRTVMMDCGIHPAHPGLGGLPYFDEVDLEEVKKITKDRVLRWGDGRRKKERKKEKEKEKKKEKRKKKEKLTEGERNRWIYY